MWLPLQLIIILNLYGGIYYEIPVKRFERYVDGKCKKGKNDFLK